MNESLYKNGKKIKTLVSYGKYDVTPKTQTFWKITYKGHGEKKTSTMYIRFTSASKFKLVNSKNEATKVKAGQAPATYWTFTK